MTRTLITHMPFFTSIQVLGLLALLVVTLGIFGSGMFLLALFYVALALWSLLVSYRLVIAPMVVPPSVVVPSSQRAEQTRPDLFVAEVKVDERPLSAPYTAAMPVVDSAVPMNLPTVGYANFVEAAFSEVKQEDSDDLARDLEAQAHAAHVLLSTDALRYFISTLPEGMEGRSALDAVIKSAKEKYPNEDGWVVVSEERMRELCVVCLTSAVPASSSAPFVPTIVPEGTGSLAEMIAVGNVSAAFALIGHRPMFALADAVADFDALYRGRRGSESVVSALLTESTAALSDDQIRAIIAALTSALDGMYTTEAEAVKTAIMKAVKVCA